MTLPDTLKQIGFEDREIKVYLALLELGESTVLPISQKAGLKRTYCYDILESLRKKELVSHIEKQGRRRYSAEDPSRIESLLQQKLADFAQILPELKSIHNQSPAKPKIRFYEGADAVMMLSDVATNASELMAITDVEAIYRVFGDHINAIGDKVVRKNQKTRELVTRSNQFPDWTRNYRKPNQEMRYLPDEMRIDTDMLIYEDKLILMSYSGDIHAVMIEGSQIVDTHKKLFELLWAATPPTEDSK